MTPRVAYSLARVRTGRTSIVIAIGGRAPLVRASRSRMQPIILLTNGLLRMLETLVLLMTEVSPNERHPLVGTVLAAHGDLGVSQSTPSSPRKISTP